MPFSEKVGAGDLGAEGRGGGGVFRDRVQLNTGGVAYGGWAESFGHGGNTVGTVKEGLFAIKT